MSQKNATAVAQLTLALGTLTAFAITAAAPATALPRTEPRQPHPAHSAPLAVTDHYYKQITETAAPADRVAAGATDSRTLPTPWSRSSDRGSGARLIRFHPSLGG